MPPRFRATVLAAGLLATGLLAAGCGTARPPAGHPSLIFLVLDTCRADRWSCLAYPDTITPNIDILASEGVLYEECISPGAWTLPSHATLFTGLYPREHGAHCRHLRLGDERLTLAEILAEAGYRTAGFSNNVWVAKGTGLAQGFGEFHDIWRRGEGPQPPAPRPDEGAAETNERILRWFDERPDSLEPFFLFVNYLEPHLPYAPPAPYDRAFLPEGADPAMVADVRTWKYPRELGCNLRVPGMEVSEEEFAILRSQYDGEIAYLDARVGELMEALYLRGALDRSILVITSDHGEHLGYTGLMDHKLSVSDALVRVPLLVRFPPEVPAGVRIAGQVQTTALLPTLLDLCNVERPEFERAQRLPLRPSPAAAPAWSFAEFQRPTIFLDVVAAAFPRVDTRPFDRSLLAARSESHKYIRASDGSRQLYDLEADPRETVNLADREPALCREMEARLREFEAANPPGPS